jgi:hypothetical protein
MSDMTRSSTAAGVSLALTTLVLLGSVEACGQIGAPAAVATGRIVTPGAGTVSAAGGQPPGTAPIRPPACNPDATVFTVTEAVIPHC